MDTPRYITQITGDWIKRVSQGANLKAGPGIKLTPDGDGIKIEVDQDVWKQWIWTWVRRGTMAAGIHVSNTASLSDLASISLDPGV